MIGKRLAELRKKTRKTAAQVADEIGVSESTYRDWEQGRQIRGEPYLALAKALDTSLTCLLTGEMPPLQRELEKAEAILRNARNYL